jgi:hypothetical protein
MQKTTTSSFFETSDLYLASFLLTRGLQLRGTHAENPARVVFVLTPRPEAEDLEAYAEGKALVNVGEFGRSLRTLKRALYRAKDGRRR